MQGVWGDGSVDVSGVRFYDSTFFASFAAFGVSLVVVSIGTFHFVAGDVPSELEVLRAAAAVVDAGEEYHAGKDFESFVTNCVVWDSVGDDAAVTDAFAVDSDVDWGARKVAVADGTYQVFHGVL